MSIADFRKVVRSWRKKKSWVGWELEKPGAERKQADLNEAGF